MNFETSDEIFAKSFEKKQSVSTKTNACRKWKDTWQIDTKHKEEVCYLKTMIAATLPISPSPPTKGIPTPSR